MSRTGFEVPRKKERIAEIEREMQSPGFWDVRERAQALATELAALKKEIETVGVIGEEIAGLRELADAAHDDEVLQSEIAIRTEELRRRVAGFEMTTYFSGKYDKGHAILSVYAGAGGKDAEDWAAMLMRMYQRWAERKEFSVTLLHEHYGEYQGPSGWGIKNATLRIAGPYAFGNLKRETGVHRLVRISPFNSQKLRHTSFALVDVMPEFVEPKEVEVRPEDLRVEFFRSSGPGGQNVNKRETAVRITHVPSKIHVAVQSERTQERNRDIAMQMLAAKLYQEKVHEQEREQARLKGENISIEWGSQIRSYVLHPYQMVKDHRTEHETSQIEKVLDGDLDGFIEAEVRGKI
ncbi:MAG: peptide chain release factor 2 [Candidatus Sungbacteria bacterium RIFCSPLOWO2_02_FULL_51_17]|uniref:Peptide chain release factor 2 n=1 Tax=Candidatus Sungbacteria bacterium RIFCSPHIGHO2_02_FULL_51_29 TaxID=1802273 RepID=A0A1G2KPG2_9BACT|nr:MAG: peptide chain release factor 2 [Candidatus Sungbacteria bacterium RIFCSPHIGHO2_01_FULL_51_22]OHA01298.1 MAG: peptide chain release factor 2 [Candidatus Sungbacteria bacterium RIFCSPHIGHO2_02_FULL_51_29]OHA06473.1 MAG: peptide chain release factor 2 [Candidatus Sungbacteria bacterium RIFCSPLOWO2_01_FULL_51_34]OHA12535.1 MAG: peptide chain release factor 2 [Candidatus Sungbacteria bacterium RIFCSPLOWO2_02_FULL_51_17]